MTVPDGVFITPLEAGKGIRLAVKDLFDTAGVRTTYGSAVFAEHVPSRTATAVALLEAAGYVDIGKTNLHEFAYGVTTQNLHYGTAPNPAAPGRTSGGSSGGSAAALALDLAPAALGTDSGGSIRIPAACCGIVGLKPTFGLVPTDGVFPLAPSFDHAGPMARTVAACVEMMHVLAPELSIASLTLGDLTVGTAWSERADPLVRVCFARAAAAFRDSRPVEFPVPEGIWPLFMREAADVHRDLYEEQSELYGENISPKIERALAVTDAEAAAATSARAAYAAAAAEALDGLDLLLTPTLPFVAPANDGREPTGRYDFTRFTFPFNVLGWPALALPCGLAEDGLPASVQIIGRAGDDALVLAAGLALEAALAR